VRSALESVKGVSEVEVGPKTGDKADATVTAASSVKIKDLIKALKKKGFDATEIQEEEKKAA